MTVIIVALLAYLVAGLVKGTTGLGFSTVCLPFLVVAAGLKEALPLVIVPSLVSNVTVMRDAGHFRETVKRFWLLYAALIPGIIAGLALLDRIDSLSAAAVLGGVLCVYALYALSGRQGRLGDAWDPAAISSSLCAGRRYTVRLQIV